MSGNRRRWTNVIVVLLVDGLLLAIVGRALTAPTHGANIGAGLAIAICTPVAVCLSAWAAYDWVKFRRNV